MTHEFLRKLTLGLLGVFASEALFTNMSLSEILFDPLTLAIYFFAFAMMDEFVQKYNFGTKAVFYLGALFGLVLEGFFVASIHENPFFQIIFTSILWHGLITVLMSFIIIDLFYPRVVSKRLHRGWVAISGAILLAILAFMGIQTFPVIFSALPVYTMIGLLILALLYLLYREKDKKALYQPRSKLGIILLVSGFIIGTILQVSSAEGTYQLSDHVLRFFIAISVLGLVIYRMKKIQHTLLRESP